MEMTLEGVGNRRTLNKGTTGHLVGKEAIRATARRLTVVRCKQVEEESERRAAHR